MIMDQAEEVGVHQHVNSNSVEMELFRGVLEKSVTTAPQMRAVLATLHAPERAQARCAATQSSARQAKPVTTATLKNVDSATRLARVPALGRPCAGI